jgi:voltage-gated potassium channel
MQRASLERFPSSATAADPADVSRLAHTLFILLVAIVALADAVAYYFLPLPETVREVLFISDSACALILLVNFFTRWAQSPSKIGFLVPWGWLTLLGSLPGLPFLRILLVPQLVRTIWRLRRTTPDDVRAQARRRLAESTLFVVGALIVVLVTSCSIAVVLVEADAPQRNIVTGGDAVWWAIVTVATVGYGDRYPVSSIGRIIGVVLMFGGVTVFSVLTSFIAATFVGRDQLSARDVAELRQALEASRRAALPPVEPSSTDAP